MTTEPEAGRTAVAADRSTDEARIAKMVRRRGRRRVAKALLYVSLIATAVTTLAEPVAANPDRDSHRGAVAAGRTTIVPIGTAAVALSLWD